LGLLTASAGNPVQFGITQGQKQLLARLQLDPLALTIRNYESISVPLPNARAAQAAVDAYFWSATYPQEGLN
jgi:hypothetical protein